MPENAYIGALRKLIEREVSNPRFEFDGYADEPHGLTRLTVREAQTAIDFDIPVGVCSLYSNYHGSHKGEYSYNLTSSAESLRRLLSERSNENYATIAPHMRHPEKLLLYIREIHEIKDELSALDGLPPREVVMRLKKEYPPGCRVELVQMPDSQTNLLPGDCGTVISVDDIGTIHVNWDNGSCLGVAYGADRVKHL